MIPSIPTTAAKRAGALALGAACLLLGTVDAGAQANEAERFLSQAKAAAGQIDLACRPPQPALGSDGRVTGSPLLEKIVGSGAGTTGGLGMPLLTVTRLDDSRHSQSSPSPQGSLRWAVERARAQGGGWIVFDPSLKGSIRLAQTLRLPSNTTIEGNCGAVEITAPPSLTQVLITGAQNVVVSGLSFTKETYDDNDDKIADAVSLSDEVDRVAVLHNAFHRCGDGCVDVVRRNRFPTTSRVTVAFNRFENHNKVMLMGTLTCYGREKDAQGCDKPVAHLDGALQPTAFVTVMGNVFDGTSQRHPKVVSNAAVHFVNNLVHLRATPYSNGEESAVYGAAAGGGGVLVAEGNVFVNPLPRARVGAGSVTAVRTSSGGGDEPDGVVAAQGNVVIGQVRVVEQQPELARAVRLPRSPVLSTAGGAHVPLAACLMRLAGPQGASSSIAEGCPKVNSDPVRN